MFEFVYPWFLTLFVLLPFLYMYLAGHKGDGILIIPDAAKIRRAAPRKRFDPVPLLLVLVFALLITALSRPRTGIGTAVHRGEGIDMILALDLSGSMDAIDIPARVRTQEELRQALADGSAIRRIDSAKNALSTFISRRPDDRIGLTGFGELAYTLAPPTLDHGFLLRQLKSLETGQLGERTGIAAPIAAGIRQLQGEEEEENRRIIVLFTDGINNVEDIITPEAAAAMAAERNIILYTVGIGGEQALVEGPFGMTVAQGEFDEAALQKLAELGKGKYFHAADAQALQEVMAEIDSLEKVSFEAPEYIQYNEIAPYLAGAALLLLFAAVILQNTVFMRLP